MHSFTREMHAIVRKGRRLQRRADRKAKGMDTDSEDTGSDEGPNGEMHNFQDLQLGSMAPLVRRDDHSFSSSLTRLISGRT